MHTHEAIDVAQLALHVQMSPYHFHRIFSKKHSASVPIIIHWKYAWTVPILLIAHQNIPLPKPHSQRVFQIYPRLVKPKKNTLVFRPVS